MRFILTTHPAHVAPARADRLRALLDGHQLAQGARVEHGDAAEALTIHLDDTGVGEPGEADEDTPVIDAVLQAMGDEADVFLWIMQGDGMGLLFAQERASLRGQAALT